MFRLYNAAFARFPDAEGLEYWIDKNGSGQNSKREVAQSFLASDEFSDKYGDNVSTEDYVKTLYDNILGRTPDLEGYNYWVGQLSSGKETRAEALLGFAESAENKALFSDMTGLTWLGWFDMNRFLIVALITSLLYPHPSKLDTNHLD